MHHLNEEGARRFATGQCTPEETASIQHHLEECRPCVERVALQVGARTRTLDANERAMAMESGTVRYDSHPDVPQPPEASPGGSPPTDLEYGAALGRYLLLHELGQGGMGVVYAAYDPQLERKVALKVLHEASNSSREQALRLLREAQAMARIAHPNVVAVYDAGTTGGRIFMAMELVEGTTLSQWLEEHKRPWREVLEAFLAAGRGLAAAHAAGLVHRDFKPSNVLVRHDGRVQVTDFGLARLVSLEEPCSRPTSDESSPREPPSETPPLLASPLTQAGKVLGTPFYMALEQYMGRTADARSDQFSFCAALYYALFQQRPFKYKQLQEAAHQRLLDRTSRGVTPPLSQPLATRGEGQAIIHPPPREPRLPSWLKKALMRGLSLEPEQRFSSMEELLERLSGPPAAVRWARRGAVAAVGVALVALGAQGLAQRQGALCSGAERKLAGVWDEQVKQQAEAAFLASGKSYAPATWKTLQHLLDTHTRGWVTMHTDACEATRLRGEQTEAALALRMACLERQHKSLTALTGMLVQADATVVAKANDLVAALPDLERCSDVEALASPTQPPEAPDARAEYDRISALLAEARARHSAGRYQEAQKELELATVAARELNHAPLLAEALEWSGAVQLALGNVQEAIRSYQEAYSAADLGRDDLQRAQVGTRLLHGIGYHQARVDLGEQWLTMTRSALERVGGNTRVQLNLELTLCAVFSRAHRLDEAMQSCERGLALIEKNFGPDHPQRARFLTNLSVTHALKGDQERALEMMKEAHTLIIRLSGTEHPDVINVSANLGQLLVSTGKYDEALTLLRRTLPLTHALLGRRHPMSGSVHHMLGRALHMSGHYDEAIQHNLEAIAIYEEKFGPKHQELVHFLRVLGFSYVELGQGQQATRHLQRAMDLGIPDEEVAADTRFNLARALMLSKGKPERARALATEAQQLYAARKQHDKVQQVQAWRTRHRL